MRSCVHAGYWYVAVHNDSDVSTTIASSTLVRTAFMSGPKLPPDDTVSSNTFKDVKLSKLDTYCFYYLHESNSPFTLGIRTVPEPF